MDKKITRIYPVFVKNNLTNEDIHIQNLEQEIINDIIMNIKKIDEAIKNCYIQIYNNSEPKADFNVLLNEATIDEFGRKVIDFNSYEIDEAIFNDIVNKIIKEYNFVGYKKKQFYNTILLGCSPRFKK